MSEEKQTVRCPNCGKEIDVNQKFCTNCGAELNLEDKANETENKFNKSKKIKFVLLILSLILVLGFVACLIFKKVEIVENFENLKTAQHTSSINCDNFKEIDVNTEHEFQYYQDYIQCAFDVNIKKLNKEHKIVEQEPYWDNLDFLLEHVYEDSERYGEGLPNPLPGKYNSLEKIYNAYDKYFIPYHLGKIALGQTPEGPNYMYGQGSWEKYYEVTKDSYDFFKKMAENEQIEIAQNVSSLTDNLLKNNKFKDTYYKDTYIINMLGLLENTDNEKTKEILKKAVIKLWKSQQDHSLSYNLINNSIFEDNALEELNSPNKAKRTSASYNLTTPNQVLAKIDELQARYFSIVKRNNALLDIFGDEECQQDLDELKALFSEVEKNIDKNNYYLQKYHEIEKKYAQNQGETTVDINDFASKHYEAVDNLLNEIYKEVKKKLPEEDFNQLKKGEIQWIKDVNSYQEVFEQQEFGTIRTLVKLGYEINMRNFRALLLMLYI